MSLQQRDKRALTVLAAAVAAYLLLQFVLSLRSGPRVVGVADSIPSAEKRLARLRQLAASVPGKEELLKQVSAELAEREKGLIQTESAPQAMAQLLEIVRRVGKAQSPPLEIKPAELGQVTALGKDYGEVQVSIVMECRIEDLLNVLADLTRQPEIVASKEIRITAVPNNKEKKISVRLTVAGVVPRRLVPEKKGLASF